jgi:diguanylate cyclase (GGDEF)-like protein
MPPPIEETHNLRQLRQSLHETAVVPHSATIRTAATREACLICIHAVDSDRGKRFAITAPNLVIGRDRACDISVTDPSVSRRHARLQQLPSGAYQVTDLDSSNGTFVNDVRAQSELLQDGSYLRVGDCHFRFLAGGNVEAAYHEEIHRLKALDPLTGAYHRGALDEFLGRELEWAKRKNRQLSVVLFDIDHFKTINDTFGHQAGDATLRALVARLKTLIRRTEFLARYGGEEFALVLPETGIEAAIVLAERCRREVAKLPFEDEGRSFPVTLSAGVSGFSGDDPATAEDLLRRADEYLYHAKRAGRNQVAPMARVGQLRPAPAAQPPKPILRPGVSFPD